MTPDVNLLAGGMSRDARQASMRRNSAIAQTVLGHERRVAMNVDNSSTECAQLNALIAWIDAAARQPQSGFDQDRLKDQRRRARDRPALGYEAELCLTDLGDTAADVVAQKLA